MTTRVFQPLGMSRTFTSRKLLAQTQNVAVPHVRVNDETFATEFADQDNIGPAAAICSSVGDLSQWLLTMVNEGRLHDNQILKSGARARDAQAPYPDAIRRPEHERRT